MCCTNLTNVTLPSTLKEIGILAFCSTGIQNINLPEGIETIGASAFFGTNITSIDMNLIFFITFPPPGKIVFEVIIH